ncbi:hypothetical protein C4D60_Mb07t26130 [Musa balbisiana]|uniref:Uncharacterized protein n=1 Tax=Musa balbisiana TaxID=52838 RepID=A0A4S8JIV2_MUSBA|nr:hypothetical protein C4D60_Mb07t26130 [Musa balbisiana]
MKQCRQDKIFDIGSRRPAFLPVLLAVHGIGIRWHPLPDALSALVNILPPVAAPPPPPPVLRPDQQHVDRALQSVPCDPNAERGVGPLPGGGPKHGNGHGREGQVPADVERHHGPCSVLQLEYLAEVVGKAVIVIDDDDGPAISRIRNSNRGAPCNHRPAPPESQANTPES